MNTQSKCKLTILIKVLICLSLIVVPDFLQSQVVIGSGLQPNKGTLLDLKEQQNSNGGVNSTRGLLLPRVNLTSINTLPPDNASFSGDDIHVGLMVYNLKDNLIEGLCPGAYVWTGLKWVYLQKKCECEYDFIGNDGNTYYVYCQDFVEAQTSAKDACTTNTPNVNGYTYHLMTTDEYAQIWNRTAVNDSNYKFGDGYYFLDFHNWITVGHIQSAISRVVGVGLGFPGGAPVGTKFTKNRIVRCVRD